MAATREEDGGAEGGGVVGGDGEADANVGTHGDGLGGAELGPRGAVGRENGSMDFAIHSHLNAD
jgi:hypothetical protein